MKSTGKSKPSDRTKIKENETPMLNHPDNLSSPMDDIFGKDMFFSMVLRAIQESIEPPQDYDDGWQWGDPPLIDAHTACELAPNLVSAINEAACSGIYISDEIYEEIMEKLTESAYEAAGLLSDEERNALEQALIKASSEGEAGDIEETA